MASPRIAARRVASVLGRLLDLVPLTWPGALALPLLFLLQSFYGEARHDGILATFTWVGLRLFALLVGLVCLTALWLLLRKRPASAEVLSLDGRPSETGFTIGWCHLNPLVKITVAWERPAGAEAELVPRGAVLAERVRAGVRGLEKQVIRRIRVADAFGLSALTLRQVVPQLVRIAPDPGRVAEQALLQQKIAGDAMGHPEGKPVGDYLETRAYGPGDPLKTVLWKHYARTGQMIVRAPEPALSPSPRTLAYFVAGPADEPSAGVARALLENGSLGTDFLFGADGESGIAATPGAALDQIIRSSRGLSSGAEGLAEFLTRGEARGSQACILFVPARPGPWLDRAAEALQQHRGPFRAVVGVDEVRSHGKSGWVSRLLFRPARQDAPTPTELKQIHERLTWCGAQVHVLCRATGEPIDV